MTGQGALRLTGRFRQAVTCCNYGAGLWGVGACGVFAAEPVSGAAGGAAMMCAVWREMKRPDGGKPEELT